VRLVADGDVLQEDAHRRRLLDRLGTALVVAVGMRDDESIELPDAARLEIAEDVVHMPADTRVDQDGVADGQLEKGRVADSALEERRHERLGVARSLPHPGQLTKRRRGAPERRRATRQDHHASRHARDESRDVRQQEALPRKTAGDVGAYTSKLRLTPSSCT